MPKSIHSILIGFQRERKLFMFDENQSTKDVWKVLAHLWLALNVCIYLVCMLYIIVYYALCVYVCVFCVQSTWLILYVVCTIKGTLPKRAHIRKNGLALGSRSLGYNIVLIQKDKYSTIHMFVIRTIKR